MPLEIEYGPKARADLYAIWSYIAADNPSAADKLISRFTGIFTSLAANPMLGRPREELRPGLRSFPHGRYVIYYREVEQSLRLLRILSSYRDVTPEMMVE